MDKFINILLMINIVLNLFIFTQKITQAIKVKKKGFDNDYQFKIAYRYLVFALLTLILLLIPMN